VLQLLEGIVPKVDLRMYSGVSMASWLNKTPWLSQALLEKATSCGSLIARGGQNGRTVLLVNILPPHLNFKSKVFLFVFSLQCKTLAGRGRARINAEKAI